jgi:hypothetical protein
MVDMALFGVTGNGGRRPAGDGLLRHGANAFHGSSDHQGGDIRIATAVIRTAARLAE